MPAITRKRAQATMTLPEFHPGQQAVADGLRRFNWLCAGRRWRKTTLGMPLMVVDSLQHGGDYIWGAPTYKQVRIGWDALHQACGGAQGAVEFNETRLTATFPNGAVGHYVSLDNPDNARGLTASRMVIDEASDVPRDAWYGVLRPMLMDRQPPGWALLMGTPKGRNWFWQEWMRAEDRREDSARWQIPSLGAVVEDGRLVRRPHQLENPFLPWAEIAQMWETMPERLFRQEILAEFLDDAGGVFRQVRACIGGDLLTAPPNAQRRYVIGVDLAKADDYTVCVTLDLDARQVVAFDRFNRADWGLQKARIAALARLWNDALIWMDATGLGDPIYDDLRGAGLRVNPYRFTHPSKLALVNNAVLLVEQQRVQYPDIGPLVNELSAYQYRRNSAGTVLMSAPEGAHDDCVMAFALACWPLAHLGAAPMTASLAEAMRQPISEIGGVSIYRKRF